MNLEIISTQHGCVHVAVAGNVSQSSVSQEEDPLARLLGDEAYTLTVLLNLRDTEMVDSSGIGWLIKCQKRFQEQGGRMVCYGAPPVVTNVFKLMRMDLVFEFAANAEEAEKIACDKSPES